MTRAVELLGIGSDNLRALPIDGLRRMRPDALAEAIDRDVAAGITPVAVVATAGTTLTGAIDPIDEIADVCASARRVAPRRRRLRPAGRGGRRSRAALFAGSSAPTPCSVDAHKWLYLPKACGVVLVRDARSARRARSRTSRATCRTSSTSCTRSTSRSSTRGRSAR